METVRDRPVLLERFPEGAGGKSFFQKRVPKSAPDWLTTTVVSTPNGTTSDALVAADLAHLLWAVNQGCLGFHVWPNRLPDLEVADELRIDLDPSPGIEFAQLQEARRARARAARRARHRGARQDVGLPRACTSTSRSSRGGTATRCGPPRWRSPASSSAATPTRSRPRGGRRSGAAACSSTSTRTRRTRPCSARGACGRASARQVSTPITWDELADGRARRAHDRHRARRGSPSAATPGRACTTARRTSRRCSSGPRHDLADGLMDAPWPPVYPKQPNEPPRVAPSRARTT